MYHGLNNNFLYTAYRVAATFTSDDGSFTEKSGTGFFVNATSGICFVTNRHLVDPPYADQKYLRHRLTRLALHGKQKGASNRPDADARFVFVNPTFLYSANYENDVACMINGTIEDTDGRIEYAIPQDFLATRADFESQFDVNDFLAFPGYPPWFDRLGARPILRTGTIASDPRYDYSFKDKSCGECLAYEAFSFGGSSGSPVFALQKGFQTDGSLVVPGYRRLFLIGINAGHLPEATSGHSGISYLFKSSAILDIITAAAVSVADVNPS